MFSESKFIPNKRSYLYLVYYQKKITMKISWQVDALTGYAYKKERR